MEMRRPLAAAVMVIGCIVSGGAQQPEITFTTQINFVEVHAIVTDERGAFVKGLTRDDFEIYEDNRPQKPSVFSLVDLPIERPFTPPDRALPIEPDVRAATRTFDGRIYILLLDDLHTMFNRSQLVKNAASKFVERYFGANDMAAVVHTSGRQEAGQELTRNRRLLLAAIDRFQGRKLPSAGAEKLAVHLRDVANATVLSGQSQPARSSEGLQKAESVRDPLEPERALSARRTLDSVENVAKWLADVQGRRKALLLFSEGLDYDIYEPFNRGASSSILTEAQEAVAAAQRANVNVYAVDPRGLAGVGDLIDISARSDYPQLEYGNFRGSFKELRLSQESLISLSEETGGLAIVNANDVAGGLGRIVLDNSRYYLLGYHSDSSRWRSNRFLKIEVKVKRPGLQVRARRGYLPPDRKAARARDAEAVAGTSPALAAAIGKPVPVGGLPFRVFAAPLKGTAKTTTVVMSVEIDGSSLKFTESDGRFNEKVEVSIVATDERAKVQGGDRQTFDLKLQPATYERVRQSGVRMLSRLDLPPGRYQIRVGAHETTGGTVATVPYDLEVPDYSKLRFALSGVLLTSSNADAFATANPDPQLKDVLPGPPVATRRFRPAETLTAFAEVYDDSGMAAHTVTFNVTLQDARDGRSVLNLSDRRAVEVSDKAATHGFKVEIPLKGVSPGMYVLRVEAVSTAGDHSAVQEIPFEIVR
jgi:VWFA-related protein